MKNFSSKLFIILFNTFVVLTINYSVCLNNGINTIDQKDTGNWYEKLHWWRKAKPRYEALASLMKQINNSKKDLTEKYNQIIGKFNKTITSLKIDSNIFLRKIDENIEKLNKQLEQEFLDEDQELMNKLNDEKKILENLKVNFQSLTLMKDKIDNSISNVLSDQLKSAESYEESALNSFEEIEKVLDDKKARILYETIENAGDNILLIKNYITGALKNYLVESGIKLDQILSVLNQNIPVLESKGIYLRDLTKEEIEEQEKSENSKKEDIQKKPLLKDNEKKEKVSWFKRILRGIGNFFKYIFSFFKKS
ncbi:hypothetical protein [Candidatus Babela massiliensis]|uniref:Uncharacterized protein n=1 Tax=Candidatus Babela massiliensis TaxID=673862 RepID=V6DHG3_9BACT|nr:hypothetical protein [Candidatus Babela massiliensis]CDK30984.1 hypothetical protein BABL1_gene_119 [Candidatus Babela massiliensis]